MKKVLLFSFVLLLLSCKKKAIEPIIHTVQFQSNIIITGTYDLLISGVPQLIENTYELESNTSVSLKLIRADSTKWLTGTIYLDGKAEKYDSGFKDLLLTLTTK